jgi:hypothetical protein
LRNRARPAVGFLQPGFEPCRAFAFAELCSVS